MQSGLSIANGNIRSSWERALMWDQSRRFCVSLGSVMAESGVLLRCWMKSDQEPMGISSMIKSIKIRIDIDRLNLCNFLQSDRYQSRQIQTNNGIDCPCPHTSLIDIKPMIAIKSRDLELGGCTDHLIRTARPTVFCTSTLFDVSVKIHSSNFVGYWPMSWSS